MNLLYNQKPIEDKFLIYHIGTPIINAELDIENKTKSDEFCGVFVEGRNREVNCFEDFMTLKSFKLYSEYNYPIFVFLNNSKNFLNNNHWLINKWRINVIKIPEITNLQDFSRFCIQQLFFKIPNYIENVLTLQPDGLLLKSGWEKYIKDNNFDLIGAHWQHRTTLEVKTNNGWQRMLFNPVYGCNCGFSFRKAPKMRLISTKFNNYTLRQINDDNLSEDSYFSYLGFGSGLCKLPTLKECDQFSKDPITLDIYNDKNNLPFGGHYFKLKSEFPPCNHP